MRKHTKKLAQTFCRMYGMHTYEIEKDLVKIENLSPLNFPSEFFTTFNIRNTFNQKSLIQSSIQKSSSFAIWDSLRFSGIETFTLARWTHRIFTRKNHWASKLSTLIRHLKSLQSVKVNFKRHLNFPSSCICSILTHWVLYMYISFPIMNFVYILSLSFRCVLFDLLKYLLSSKLLNISYDV